MQNFESVQIANAGADSADKNNTKSNSLVLSKNNSNAEPNGYCGHYPLLGPHKPDKGYHISRILCRTNGCPHCWPIKLASRKKAIKEAAAKHNLRVFVTLTIPNHLCAPEDSPKMIQKSWNRYRAFHRKKFGALPDFISVLEFTKKGYAHLHILLSNYVPWHQLDADWKRMGGGHVDVKSAKKNAHRYLAKYLAKRVADTKAKGARLVNCSRSIKLNLRNANPDYVFKKVKYEDLKSTFRDSINSETFFDQVETGFYTSRPINMAD